ncbi:ABC transporter permease subunit [Clostridium intestinale]|uniref:ABC transporter permease subunit n=1 Tax=Clostridium intestinale TaxID=36845 RepID=UPI0028E31886|nr:ABC transporter permease subunit [Clostridium intestinale]
MKKRNLPLIFGGFIIVILAVVVVFPRWFTSDNPYVMEGVRATIQKNVGLSLQGAPFAPSKENLLGTDQLGRDILSLIIYGTRLTLELGFFIVLGRFLVAIPLGIAAGFGNNLCKSIINFFSLIFSAIPALIISLFVLNISFFKSLDKNQSILAFVVVLTIVGFGKLAELIRERVQGILSKSFIDGEKAIGKSNLAIAMKNVLPHLSAEIMVLVFMEMALALSMIMELGYFGIYVGNLRVFQDTNVPINISFEPEWASMISTSLPYITKFPWMVISPALTFFISIFGFNLFGEGLREKLQGKNSKVGIRNIPKKVYKPIAAFMAAILIVGIFNFGVNTYKTGKVKKQLSSIMDWEFKDQVVIGSEEAEYTANNLKNSLQEIGLSPVGEEYISKYDIDKLKVIDSYYFKVDSDSLVLGKDFSVISNKDFSIEGKVYKDEALDLFTIKDFSIFDGKLLVLDEDVYSRETIADFSNIIKEKSKALGVIDVISKNEKLPNSITGEESKDNVIYLTKDSGEKLKHDSNVSISIKTKTLEGSGKNVLAMIPGSNKNLSEQVIIISMGYNYLASDKESSTKKIDMMLEIAKRLYDNKENQGRSIMFAFWDGNLTEEYSGVKKYVAKPAKSLEFANINVDLTNMDVKGDTLTFDEAQVPVTKYSSWGFNHQFQLNLKEKGFNINQYVNKKKVSEIVKNPNSQQVLYYVGAVPTISMLGSEENNTNKNLIEKKFVDVLVSSISKTNY